MTRERELGALGLDAHGMNGLEEQVWLQLHLPTQDEEPSTLLDIRPVRRAGKEKRGVREGRHARQRRAWKIREGRRDACDALDALWQEEGEEGSGDTREETRARGEDRGERAR